MLKLAKNTDLAKADPSDSKHDSRSREEISYHAEPTDRQSQPTDNRSQADKRNRHNPLFLTTPPLTRVHGAGNGEQVCGDRRRKGRGCDGDDIVLVRLDNAEGGADLPNPRHRSGPVSDRVADVHVVGIDANRSKEVDRHGRGERGYAVEGGGAGVICGKGNRGGRV